MITIPAYTEALNGTPANGMLAIDSSKLFWPGSKAHLSGDNLEGVALIVLECVDATHIRVGLAPEEGVVTTTHTHYASGHLDLSAYTVAKNARINVPQQTIFMLPDGGVVPRLPNIWS